MPLLVERNATAISPGKDIRAGDRKAITPVFVKPVLTAVQLAPLLVERKDTATCSGKEIRSRDGKCSDISVCQAGIGPARTIVGGKKDAATCPRKDIRAGDGKSKDNRVR